MTFYCSWIKQMRVVLYAKIRSQSTHQRSSSLRCVGISNSSYLLQSKASSPISSVTSSSRCTKPLKRMVNVHHYAFSLTELQTRHNVMPTNSANATRSGTSSRDV